jgi:lipopolysaccharide export system protein LptC
MFAPRSFARAAQWLHLYLPAMLMALLALGTWWLVQRTPVAISPAPAAPPQRQQDYEMHDFASAVYSPSGQVLQSLRGVRMQHFNNGEIDMQQPRLLQQDATALVNRRMQAQAARALGQDDGSDITLLGQVQLQQTQAGQDDLQVQAPKVRIFDDGQRLHASDGVRSRRGNLDLQGEQMDWDNDSRILTMQGAVRTVVQPR